MEQKVSEDFIKELESCLDGPHKKALLHIDKKNICEIVRILKLFNSVLIN